MKFIDLFSGIGGFRTALEKNGHECIAYSEIDKYAKQSYQAIYDTEGEIDLGDITEISEEYLKHFKEENDIVVGGSPCQSFSISGSRRGFEDTRGTLFFEYAKVVKETQPKYFLYENVKGMLSHDNGNTIRTVLKAFDELGYYIDFNVFNSKNYDIPQNRERIYIIGKRKDLEDNPLYHTKVRGKKKLEEVHNWAVDNIEYVSILPTPRTDVTKRLVDLLDKDVEDKYYLSPTKIEHFRPRKNLEEVLKDGSVKQVGNVVKNKTTFGGNPQRGRIYDAEGVSPALNICQGDTIPKIIVLGNTSATQHNSHNVHSVDGIIPTLAARDYKDAKQILTEETEDGRYVLRIRKITPLECWRLQGFSDEQYYKALNSGVSNSQLYKQAGNSVTTNVVDYIVSYAIK